MKAELIKKEGYSVNFEIAIDAAEFEGAIDKAYKKTRSRYNIAGFRKGKAPRKIIELNYGKGVFFNDALDILLPEVYPAAIDELGLFVVSHPSIDIKDVKEDGSLVLVVDVDVRPELTVENYKGVEIEKVEAEVTEDQIDAELKALVERQSRMVDTEGPIENGNIAVIDFKGLLDGETFEGGTSEGYSLEVGSGTFIPGFEEQLVGKKVGEEVEVNVTFPEEYQAKELAGKPAMFKVTIKEIKVKEYPKVDDEFAQEVSEFDTLAEYKADIKKDLVAKKKEAAAAEKESKVIEEIVKNSEMDIPEKMIEAQAQQMVEEFAQNIAMQGISFDQYMQFTGSTVEQLLEQVKPQAKARIESSLVLEEVVKAEKIEATDEEFEKELEDMATRYQMEKEKVAELLSDDDKKNLRNDICLKKAAKFVTSKAK